MIIYYILYRSNRLSAVGVLVPFVTIFGNGLSLSWTRAGEVTERHRLAAYSQGPVVS